MDSSLSTKPKLTELQWDLIGYVEQFWAAHKRFPTMYELKRGLKVSKDNIESALYNELTERHLKARGIDWNVNTPVAEGLDQPEKTINKLTKHQMAVAMVMLNPVDQRSTRKKLEALGVSETTYNGWLNNPVFLDFMQTQSEEIFGKAMPLVHTSLAQQAINGDTRATKLFYEVSGRYRGGQQETANVQMLIIRLIEVIQKYVKEPAVLQAIAEEVKEITNAD